MNRARFLLPLLLLGAGSGALGDHLDGSWRSEFDGLALAVNGRLADVYEASESSIYLINRIGFDQDHRYTTSDGRVFQLQLDEGRLQFLTERGDLFLSFLPVEALPPVIAPTGDPGVAFDRFWEAFNENYALFDLGEVDWAEARDVWRGTAQGANNDTLFDIFSTMLAPLNDVHTTVTRSDTLETYRSGPERDPFWDGRENTFLNLIAEHYLGVPLQSRFTDSRLRFGILPGNVGYLAVSSFLDAQSGQPFADTLDAVLAELSATRGLVIDLRFNPGGTDGNTLALMERLFGPHNTIAHARQVRLSAPPPEAFTDPLLLSIEPRDNPFHRRPVAVLTSHNSASAAEAFLLPVMNEPWFTQVGEATRGVFSKLLFRNLPNGWLVTLSNERYASLTGREYEQQGVPPGIAVDRADYDLDQGVDAALDAALAAIGRAPQPLADPVAPGLAVNGVWYDPARDGEGWHIQRVSDDRVFVSFYTYAPGSVGPEWVVGLGAWDGEVLRIERLFTTQGGRFGAPPNDPTAIEEQDWGHGWIRFSDCDSAQAEIVGPDEARGYVFRLRRVTGTPGLDCRPGPALALQHPALMGSWFVPERPGEGWLVSHLDDRNAVVSWYTFDADGRRLWLIGPGSIDDAGRLRVSSMVTGQGTTYGHGFDAGDVITPTQGQLEFELSTCNVGTVRFIPLDPGAETLDYPVSRLLFVDGVTYGADCD